jgi:hypothetical protein
MGKKPFRGHLRLWVRGAEPSGESTYDSQPPCPSAWLGIRGFLRPAKRESCCDVRVSFGFREFGESTQLTPWQTKFEAQTAAEREVVFHGLT